MRGAFLHDSYQTQFVPSARASGCIEGPALASPPCHPECSEGSGLTTSSETVQRALARVPDPPDALAKFFAYGELLLATAPKVTSRPRSLRRPIVFFCKFTLPSLARRRAFSHPRPGHPWPGVRTRWSDIESLHLVLTPALRSRSGVHRQAIPGLTLDASASCLAPRQQARAPVAPALRCSAQTTGGTSKAKAKQRQKQSCPSILVIPAKANPGAQAAPSATRPSP